MAKKRTPKKPKVVRVGSTPITPISEKQSRELDERIRRRKERVRKRYPDIHGRIVGYICHSMLFHTRPNMPYRGLESTTLRNGIEIIRKLATAALPKPPRRRAAR